MNDELQQEKTALALAGFRFVEGALAGAVAAMPSVNWNDWKSAWRILISAVIVGGLMAAHKFKRERAKERETP